MATKSDGGRNRAHDAGGTPEGRGGGGSRGNADRGRDVASTGKSLGRQIADLFGGLAGYQNNPNRPQYDTRTMGVPIDISPSSLLSGQNLGMSPLASAGINAVASLTGGIGGGLAATRAIQAATGMSGGPSIGGRADGQGGYGGKADQDSNDARKRMAAKKKAPPAATTLAPAGDDWTNGRNPDATKLLLDQIVSQSLNPSASDILLGA